MSCYLRDLHENYDETDLILSLYQFSQFFGLYVYQSSHYPPLIFMREASENDVIGQMWMTIL